MGNQGSGIHCVQNLYMLLNEKRVTNANQAIIPTTDSQVGVSLVFFGWGGGGRGLGFFFFLLSYVSFLLKKSVIKKNLFFTAMQYTTLCNSFFIKLLCNLQYFEL